MPEVKSVHAGRFGFVMIAAILFLLGSIHSTPLRADLEETAEEMDLKSDLDFIQRNAEEMVEANFKNKKIGPPADRDFHSRGTCLKGTFTTYPQNIGKDMKVPFFLRRAVYPMIGRFSNGRPGRKSSDIAIGGSVFGFGVKVIGVPGDKFDMQSEDELGPGSTKPLNHNQDWNLATGNTFPIPTAAIYRQERNSESDFALHNPGKFWNVLTGLIHLESYWHISYHSQMALQFGDDHVAKFSAAPCDGQERTIDTLHAGLDWVKSRNPDYSRQDLINLIKNQEICFYFRAQIRPDDHKLGKTRKDWARAYPKDDATVLWPVDVIPYTIIAKIKFPAQPQVDKFQSDCNKRVSINPGNVLQDFHPIDTDSLMTARYRKAYEGSVAKRTELNGGKQWEPDPIPPEKLQQWLASPELDGGRI